MVMVASQSASIMLGRDNTENEIQYAKNCTNHAKVRFCKNNAENTKIIYNMKDCTKLSNAIL